MAKVNTGWASLIATFLDQSFLGIPCSLPTCAFCSKVFRHISLSVHFKTWEDLLVQSKSFSAFCEVARRICLSTKGSLFDLSEFCMKCQCQERQIRRTYKSISVSQITGPVDVDSFFLGTKENGTCRRHGRDVVSLRCFGDRPQFCVIKTSKELTGGTSTDIMPLRLELVGGVTKTVVDSSKTLFDNCYYIGNPCYRSTWSSENVTILSTIIVDNMTFHLVQLLMDAASETMWDLKEVVESLPFHTGRGAYKTLECLSAGWKSSDIVLFPPQKDKVREARVVKSYLSSDERELSTNVNESLIGRCTDVTETPVKEVARALEIEDGDRDVIERTEVTCNPADECTSRIVEDIIPINQPNFDEESLTGRFTDVTETPVKDVARTLEIEDGGRDVIERTEVTFNDEGSSRIVEDVIPINQPNFDEESLTGRFTDVTETPVKDVARTLEIEDGGRDVIERTEVTFNDECTSRIVEDVIPVDQPNVDEGIQPVDEFGLTQTPVVENDCYAVESEPTSIPFLYASYPVLSEHGYENTHYSEEVPDSTKTYEEMTSTISEMVDLCITGVSAEDILAVNIRSNTVLGSSFSALNVTCDIDSIDFVSIPWGGMAFRGSKFRLLSTYCASYAEKKRYLARNNNLSCFHERIGVFPGSFFLSHAITRRAPAHTTEETLEDPLAITVLHMKSALCMESMKIRAMVPTGAVQCALYGSSNLVWLFQSFLGCSHTRNSDVTDRRTCHSLFWFLIREFLYLMLSFITRSAIYPNCDPRLACCAIPTGENRKFHDRERGPNSSFAAGLDLESDEMRAAFFLAARFMASLEQFAEVPSAYRSFSPSDNDMYKCDENVLQVVEDSDVLECLKSDIDSEECKAFFVDKIWDGRTAFGGLVRLHSDSERKGLDALPDVWSNKKACDYGYMVVEDLLVLSPVVFRVTEHGMKHAFKTSGKCRLVKNTLESEFSLSAVQDGIADVAFVMEGPRKSGVAVMMPRDTAYSSLLVPTALSHRSARQLNSQFHSTCGYPEVLGFSTANGTVSVPESVLVPDKVRRVKSYSSNRRFEATRGSSVYHSTGIPLEMELRNVSKIVCDWMNLKPGVRRTVRLKSEEQERKRKRLFDIIMHDIKVRKDSVSSSTETFGVRVELTYGCSNDFNFMDEAGVILALQDERKVMSEVAFREDFAKNPRKWPWYMRIPSNNIFPTEEEASMGFGSATLPVTLVRSRSILNFYTTLEEKLVQSARDVYRIICAYVSGNMENMPEPRSQILESIIRKSSQGTGSEIAMILCRGLLAGSKLLVDSLNCNSNDGVVQMQPFVLSACGLDATYTHGGIPQVIWARLLSLDESFERILRLITPTCTQACQLMDLHQDMEGVAAYIDEEMDIPDTLQLASRKERPGFMSQVFGSNEDREFDSLPVQERTSISRINRFAITIFRTESDEVRNRSMYHLAAFFVLLLMQDCYKELRNMLGNTPSTSLSVEEVSMHEKSLNILEHGSLNTLVCMLGRLSGQNKRWPRCHSIDGFNVDVEGATSSNGILPRMKRLLSFYKDNIGGVSPLDENNVIDYRNTLCDEDGAIDVDRFIQAMWERSGMLPQYSELVGQEDGSQFSKQWNSVISLRVFEGIMEYEDQRDLLINPDARRRGISGTKKLFQLHLASCIEICLRHAGFFNLSPLLIDCFCGPRGEANRIWGPTPTFTVLKRKTGNLSQLRRNESCIGHSNERCGLDRRFMIVRKKKLQLLKRDIRDHLEKISEVDSRKPSRGQDISEWYVEKQSIVRGFWSRSNINEVLYEYFLMVQDEKSDLGLNKDSKEYCLMVVEFVLKIRREYGNEGLALFAWNEREEDESQIRRLLDVNTSNERDLLCTKKTFQNEIDYFKKPWTVLGYPNPTKTRDGKVTKKVTVRLCSRLLFESGIVFKTVTPSRGDRRLPIERYTCLHVEYLYRKCRNAGIESCQSSHSMWRLVPDSILFTLLSNHCNSEIEKLEGV